MSRRRLVPMPDPPTEALIEGGWRALERDLAAVGISVVDPEPSEPQLVEARGQTEQGIRAATQAVREALEPGERLTKLKVAARLNTSESTLKRAMKDLRMGSWPPASARIDPP